MDVKSDERQGRNGSPDGIPVKPVNEIAEQMVNADPHWQSVPYANPPASDYFS